MTIAETPKVKNKYAEQAIGHQMRSMNNLMGAINGTTDQEYLNVDRSQITGGLPDSDSPVQIGDYVEKIN
ncbi:hypothetical protein FC65_GL000672 [Ligilactobacillus acidipiscis DSM 15836]|uniref:Uncharacterized protein n=2 Tax=Ligilactobacillus acidipiscis TaxID=89059 RepID=A0ABR5PLZ3_9LACO|nr:hypothetical protein FC65_GL000672 [Ligilactobacillus acidipiscis DSM 15836]